MDQHTLTAPIHSPSGDPTLVPSNSACEGEGLTRTDKGSCSELSSNITCIEIQSLRFIALSIATSMHVFSNEACSAVKIWNAPSSLNSLAGINNGNSTVSFTPEWYSTKVHFEHLI